MMDEPRLLAKRETNYKLIIRIIELVACLICLIFFCTLIFLPSLPIYIIAIVVSIAALTSIILLLTLMFSNLMKKYEKRWIYIALASMILYFVCTTLFCINAISWHIYLAIGLAVLTAVTFLVDIIYHLRKMLKNRKNTPRLNQIAPVSSVAVQKSEEKLTSSNEVCGTIECSVIVGDQLACNQQLCHVKWSSDQASSTPTAKLIYVQPCSSSVVNKICPACKKFNCQQCFEKTENEADLKPLSEVKSTQFPEDNENVCPFCSYKAVKVYKTEYVQTTEELDGVSDPALKPIQENIISRHVHSAKDMEKQSRAKNKLIQSSPVTPRRSFEHIMTCPQCRKKSFFKSQANKSHACPVCNQQCTNHLTCTSCFFKLPATYVQEELKKNEESRRRKSSQMKKSPKPCTASEMTQVSPEDFEETFMKPNEDKVTQVSSSELVEKQQLVCSMCNKKALQKEGKREIETQVSLDEFVEGSPRYLLLPSNRLKTAEYKGTNVSSRELIGEMQLILLGKHSAEKIFENTNFENQPSRPIMINDESTQVSSGDFLLREETPPEEDKLTQVSSRDFIQKERRPCGAPNCTHPKCAKQISEEEEVILNKQTFDELVQTEEPSDCIKSFADPSCEKGPCRIPEHVDEETITDQFKQISCQTTKSLEDAHQEEQLPKELPECIDPKCFCVINEKEILVCNYCESMHNNILPESNNLPEVAEKKSGCTCGKSTCICCENEVKEEVKELLATPKKCYCIKTENALIKCTFCEKKQKGMSEILPICTSSVTCLLYEGRSQDPNENKKSQVENLEHSTQTNQMKSTRSYRASSEDEKQKNKSMEASEKNEHEVNEDDYASSSCTSEVLSSNDSENRAFERKYLTPAKMKLMYKEEREDMSYYLANKEVEPVQNVTVFTLQHQIDNVKMESKEDAPKIKDDNDSEEEMKFLEWEALAGKHAAYQERLRKNLESNIQFGDEKKVLHDKSLKILENTQSEMQNVYNFMIKNLLERQSQKESNLLYLEKLNCGCDSEAESSKHQTANCSSRMEDFFQVPPSKFDTREHKDDDGDGNVQLDIAERIVSSDVLIISDNVSLSTITEEISGTPSDLISISKESEPSSSKEHLPEKPKVKEVDLNTTYCVKIDKTAVDGQLKKKCNQSCKRDAVFVPIIPLKLQQENKDTDKRKNMFYSARCRNASPKPCSARSEKCPRKSAGFFEPFMFSQQTYGSTKTSFTASDNESAVDSVHQQDNIKTLQSTTGSSVSFNLHEQEDPVVLETLQSQSVPITSRESIPINEESKTVFYCRHSIPCTPKKLRWQDTDMQANSLTDLSETTNTKKCSRKTYRKESDYDEDNTTPSMIIIKNFHPEMYETDANRDNEAKLVPPLPIANITPEHSDSEESRPISCSSHLSARTLQSIDHYNLECCSSPKKNPKCLNLKEMKKSKKSSGVKSQPLSTHPMVNRSTRRQFNMESTVRERRIITVQPKSNQARKKSLSPKSGKGKSTTRSFRQKAPLLSPYKNVAKKKSSRKSSARKSKMKSEPVSPEYGEYVCNCEFYKNSRINYCRVHGMGILSVPGTSRLTSSSSSKTPIVKSLISSPRKMSATPSSERPRTWQENRKPVMKSGEITPKTDDT